MGCAIALLGHGLPAATATLASDDLQEHRTVRIDGRELTCPEDVAEVLLG